MDLQSKVCRCESWSYHYGHSAMLFGGDNRLLCSLKDDDSFVLVNWVDSVLFKSY